MSPPLAGRRLQGAFFILACALVWAVTITWCKWRLGDATSQGLLTAGHFTLAEVSGLALVGGLWCWLSPRQTLRVPRSAIGLLIAIALCASVGALALFYVALEMTQQINAALLGHTQVVFIALIAFLFLGQRLRRAEMAGIPVLLGGAALITLRTPDNVLGLHFDNLGDGLVLIAAVFWAAGGVMSQRLMDRLTGPQILAWRGILATVVVIAGRGAYALWRPDGPVGEPGWIDKLGLSRSLVMDPALRVYALELLAYGTIVGLGFLCYYLGLERLKAAEAASWELSSPFFAMILAALVNHEVPTAVQLTGSAFLVGGLWWIGRPDEVPGHVVAPDPDAGD